MQLFSLFICFAKFTDPIRDVTDIRRISGGYPPSGLRVPEDGQGVMDTLGGAPMDVVAVFQKH